MSPSTLGIIIGGILPAFIFGITNVLVKYSSELGVIPPYYLIFAGLGVFILGLVLLVMQPAPLPSIQGSLASFVAGFTWGLGIFGISYALNNYNSPISVLTPLFNMNSLVAVLLGLWLFAEWQQVKVPNLMVGATLMIIGSVFVSRA